MSIKEHAATWAADKASQVTYSGSAVSLGGIAFSNEIVGLIGVVVAIAGFLVNWYFKVKQDRRMVEEHKETMRRLREKED